MNLAYLGSIVGQMSVEQFLREFPVDEKTFPLVMQATAVVEKAEERVDQEKSLLVVHAGLWIRAGQLGIEEEYAGFSEEEIPYLSDGFSQPIQRQAGAVFLGSTIIALEEVVESESFELDLATIVQNVNLALDRTNLERSCTEPDRSIIELSG